MCKIIANGPVVQEIFVCKRHINDRCGKTDDNVERRLLIIAHL